MKHTPHTLAAEVAEKPKETVFRISSWWMTQFTALLATIPALLIVWFLEITDPLMILIAFAVSFAFMLLIYVLPMTLFAKWLVRVKVKAEGIPGSTFWSTPVYMTFAEIESVEPRSILGVPHLRVKSFRESCPTLWIPLNLVDPVAFREHIAAQTAPTNPLRKSLESGNTAQKRESLPLSH